MLRVNWILFWMNVLWLVVEFVIVENGDMEFFFLMESKVLMYLLDFWVSFVNVGNIEILLEGGGGMILYVIGLICVNVKNICVWNLKLRFDVLVV